MSEQIDYVLGHVYSCIKHHGLLKRKLNQWIEATQLHSAESDVLLCSVPRCMEYPNYVFKSVVAEIDASEYLEEEITTHC